MSGLLSSLSRGSVLRSAVSRVISNPARHLNLLEYQSKQLLDESKVAIQAFRLIETKNDKKKLDDFNVPEYVVKAQILAGGRGKGHFSNGFKGGVHITKVKEQALQLADQMLGHNLITKQTPEGGILVKQVMVARSVDIVRETYFSIVMDREYNGPVIIASPAGGMDIEAVAEETPNKILTMPVDIKEGLTRAMAEKIARFLQFNDTSLEAKAADEIQKIWQLFLKVDATQIEINPLAETADKQIISVDAKFNFDDNAEYRQKRIFEMGDDTEADPKEVEAQKYNLNYIAMDGNIGCLVNGAGLAMATMDIIKLNNGSPANFLDVGGSVKEEQVLKAFQILVSDTNVKAILVNVFGGIVNCATIANGIVNASKVMNLQIPVVVRLEGTNVDAARKILKDSGMAIETAKDLDDAAAKAVRSIK